ncbi:MAG: hypothetical protein AMXMBFR61_14440 [Fimbriimonadales bacterium]
MDTLMSRPCGCTAAALRTPSWPAVVTAAVALIASHACLAQQGGTWRVSVSSGGAEASGGSWEPSISSDGRFVAFQSQAANLVPNDTNNATDVFVRDRLLSTTERVSVSTAGGQTSDSSESASISADGRFVAFASYAPELVPGDSNGARDIFVRDRFLSLTERVSVSSSGVQANDGSRDPAVSADGRFVVFSSDATNLVAGDTNNSEDVFVRDRQLGTIERVSVSSAGEQGTGASGRPAIGADGYIVAFESTCPDLVPADNNGCRDVFVRDLASWSTVRESVSSNGEQGWVWSTEPSLSYEGRFVAFASYAYNLVDDDTNGEQDIFARDRVLSLTRRVSVSSSGEQSNFVSTAPHISADGRFVAFESLASNLVGGDTNSDSDIFVHQDGPDTGYRSLSGTFDFQHLAGAVPTLTSIEYRLPGQTQRKGYWLAALTGSGQFTVPAPSGAYDLSVKHTHWLRRTMGFDTTSGDANVGTLLLRNGDVSDDNVVDLFDLTAVLVDFAKPGHRMSDLDESGQVGLSDINIVLLNFAHTGDP